MRFARPTLPGPAGVILVAASLIAVTPFFLGGSRYGFDMAIVAMAYAMFAVSWDLICGTTGELSFGHSFFVGASGFSVAIVVSRLGVDPWVALIVGPGVGALAGVAVGLVTLRHSGPVFTLVTMAAQLSLYRTIFVWGSMFGGEEGVVVNEVWLGNAVARYSFVAVVSLATLAASMLLRESAFGLQLRATGGDRRVGQSAGVAVHSIRLKGFLLSGAVSGLAATVLVLHNCIATHEIAGDTLSGLIFLLAMVGGAGTIIGPWLAAFLYMAYLRESLFSIGEWQSVVSLVVLFLLIWIAPRGLVRSGSRLWGRRTIVGGSAS